MGSAAGPAWASCIRHLQRLVDQRPTGDPADVGVGSRNYDAAIACLTQLDAMPPHPARAWRKLVQEDKVCAAGSAEH